MGRSQDREREQERDIRSKGRGEGEVPLFGPNFEVVFQQILFLRECGSSLRSLRLHYMISYFFLSLPFNLLSTPSMSSSLRFTYRIIIRS